MTWCCRRSQGAPRVRGVGPWAVAWEDAQQSSAPCSRGWTQTRGTGSECPAERPVFAGLDLLLVTAWRQCFRAPRVRGVGPYEARCRAHFTVSAPCSRGWTRIQGGDSSPPGERPVFAGLDLALIFRHRGEERAPRVRGVGPKHTHRPTPPQWSAPCSRGWTIALKGEVVRRRERPVFAGLDRRLGWN